MNKKSIIRAMLWGDEGFFEQITLSEEYKAVDKKMIRAADNFLKKLNEEQKELFKKVYECILDRNVEYSADSFTEGFKFGLLLGIECME